MAFMTDETNRYEWDRYECSVCGYIYDPVAGDSKGGIPPGVSFDDLPADWVCP